MDDDPPLAVLHRLLPRPAVLAGAASLSGAALIAVIARQGMPAADAAAPPAPPPAASFGDAVPSDHFIQEFQKQVVQQLQATLDQANRDQDQRLERFEQQARQMREQSDALQRSVEPLQSQAGETDAAGAHGPPRVNARLPRDEPGRTEPAPAGAARPRPEALGEAPVPPHDKPAEANLSPHGFAEGRLLNGVVAVVGGPERESIVALSGRYEAANRYTVDLDGCFALVQGRPELPAGRIDFKVARLTCNFPDGASKTWDVAGWLVDSDGIRGVRARIVQNAGRKALVAAAGGALSGFGRRLSQEQYQFNAGPLASSASFVGSSSHDALGASADGAAGALGQSIADYYNLYAPSLQIGGGTPVSLVIANELRFPPSGRAATQTHTVP
jgi:conjugal transfer pilus assembly protein TraB